MEKRIIYKNPDTNFLCVIIPVKFSICGLTIEEIAQKDVPTGVPYKIVNASDLPKNRENRDKWDYDFSEINGYGK